VSGYLEPNIFEKDYAKTQLTIKGAFVRVPKQGTIVRMHMVDDSLCPLAFHSPNPPR
jgi:hypothetical protein